MEVFEPATGDRIDGGVKGRDRVLVGAILVALLGPVQPGLAQSPEPQPVSTTRVYPGFAAFDVPHAPAIPAELAKPLLRGGRLEPGYFVVHFRGPITAADEEWLGRLGGLGGPLGGGARARHAIPDNALVLWIEGLGDWLELRRSARIDWVGRYQPAYKLDPALLLDALVEEPLHLAVELVPGHPLARLREGLEALGARCLGPAGERLLAVEARPGEVPELAHLEGIYRLWEEPELEPSSGGLVAAPGGGGSSQKLETPITLVLQVTAGWNSVDGSLSSTKIQRLRSSDGERVVVGDEKQLALAFEPIVPPEAVVTAIRFFVEHHEESGVDPGDILWRLAHGPLDDPEVVRTISAPLRYGESSERLDVWAPDRLVPDPNALELVIQNDDRHDDSHLDRVYAEVDYLRPDLAPSIISTPSATGTLGEAYLYDADGRAEASGATPITWSIASGPAGLAIDSSTGAVSWIPGTSGSLTLSIRAANAHGTATQTFTVEVQGEAPLPSTLLPANPVPIVYCPPERLAYAPAKSQQRLNIFLPPGQPPSPGWPVVLNNRAGGGIAAAPLGSLSDTGGTAPLHAFVASGVAVVDFGVTGIGNGQGLFYPPGHPSGRYESFRPADDNPEKDAEWAIQKLKTLTGYPLDATRICLRGSSQGAIISVWAAMGPERARASGSTHVRTSTRVKAVLALQPPTSVWAFDQSPDFTSRMVAHFEQAAFPGVPATALGQVAPELQKAGSIMRFAFETAEARLHNQTQAICLLYGEPVKQVGGLPADMTLDAQGFPKLYDTLGLPYVHDSWAGYVLHERLIELSALSADFHDAHSVFAVRSSIALPPPYDHHTHTFSGGITGPEALAIAHEWVLRTLAVTSQPLVTGTGMRRR